MQVIIDTNFLLIPFKFKVDIITEIERLVGKPDYIIISGTKSELAHIEQTGNGEDKMAARFGFEVLKRIPYRELAGLSVDDAIVDMSGPETAVCTMDKELRDRLIKKGAKIIVMRQKNRLDWA